MAFVPVGGCPGLLGELGQDVVDVEVVQVGTHGELHFESGQVRGERLAGASGVGARQHRPMSVLVGFAQVPGQLRERGIEHLDVVGRGAGASVAWAQQPGQRLPAAARTVIGIGQKRVKPEGRPSRSLPSATSEPRDPRPRERLAEPIPPTPGVNTADQ